MRCARQGWVIGMSWIAWWAVPSPAAAQIPVEVVVEPLVRAAEEDVASGRAALAQARSRAVMEVLHPAAPLTARAQQVLAAAPVNDEVPPQTEVFAPIVEQAEQDLATGSLPIATARLDFVLARVPADTPVAQRARQLRDAASNAVPPPPAPGTPQVTVGPTWPAAAVPPEVSPVEPAAERPPVDPERRGTPEMVELYISAGLFGGFTGVWLPYLAGVEDNDRYAPVAYVLVPAVFTALTVTGAVLLDVAGEPMRTGVAPAISTGIRWGAAQGLLIWASAHESVTDPRDAVSLVWGASAAGLALGAAAGYGLRPSTDQVRFVEGGMLWGAWLSGLVALGLEEDSELPFQVMLGGVNTGLVATAVLAAAGLELSARQVFSLHLGLAVGAGVGAGITGLFAIRNDVDRPVWAMGLGIGSAVGLGVSAAFLAAIGEDDTGGPDSPPDVAFGVSPVKGGAVVEVSGSLL